MLCPKCYDEKKNNRLKVKASLPYGPFSQCRHYVCLTCGYTTFNFETLGEQESGMPENHIAKKA